MAIRELFHVMHMVDDIDAAQALFDRLFAPKYFAEKHWSDLDKRWASLGDIGDDYVQEFMEASKDEADAGWPLPKFARRFGEHLHSWAWYTEPDQHAALFRRLVEGGVRVAGGAGLLAPDTPDDQVPPVLFCHGRDTYGQVELMTYAQRMGDTRLDPGWDGSFWRDEHPMGVLRSSHFTNSVDDLDRARVVFADLLGGTIFHEQTTGDRQSVFVAVGTESVVELARPTTGGTLLAEDLEANGPLPHQVTFLVKDLDAAARHIQDCGVRILERTEDTIVMDPADTFGSPYAVTTARIPNDPRDA